MGVQRIRYVADGAYREKAVLVRTSRTMDETRRQYGRLESWAMSDGHRMNRLQDIFHRTFYALHATGRGGYTVKPGIKCFVIENV